MNIIHLSEIPEEAWESPKGKYGGASREVSVALGRKPLSLDLRERHPFDVEICRIPPGKSACPFHSHSAQWEYYQVLSGAGSVRHKEGIQPVKEGDVFLFAPDAPHQLINDGDKDFCVLIVADNPVGESCHYPDSGKWLVRSPQRQIIRSESIDYYEGEE